jgi:hypothetical protein
MILFAVTTASSPGSGDPAASDSDAPPPRVRVVTTLPEVTEGSSLYDWLVVRLLEEGYAVAGGDGAEIDLTIWPTAHHGWTVRAHGKTSENFGVSIGEDEAVARLELLHRAVDALESVEPRDRPEDADARAFAIELAPTFDADRQVEVESEIALAVLDGGGSLAPDRSAAKFAVCAAPAEDATRVHLVTADEPCPVPETSAAELPPAGELAQQLVAAALLARDDEAVPEPVPEPAHDSERPPAREPRLWSAPEPRRTWANAPLVLRGGFSVGVIGRIQPPDAVVAGSLLIGREPGLSAWIDLQLWPSTGGPGLFIFETLPAVGVRVRPVMGRSFAFDLGALVGVQTHSYRFRLEEDTASGIAVDASFEGAVGYSVTLWRDHELQMLFRFGRSGRRRSHIHPDDRVLWEREAWRVGATIGLMFGRRLRR